MASRARIDRDERWDRVRVAYRDLVSDNDPVPDAVGGEFVDLRPLAVVYGGVEPGVLAVVSGPDDLREIRAAVESVTGPGSWPGRAAPLAGERFTGTIPVGRAAATALVASLEGFIDDRTGAWRTWRTAVDTMGKRLDDLTSVTVDAVVVDLASLVEPG